MTSTGPRARFRGLVVAALVLLAAGACSDPAENDAPRADDPGGVTVTASPPPAPRGIQLSFIQQRFEEGTNRAQLRVVNNTSKDLVVTKVGLRWPGYPGGLQRSGEVVAAGSTLDLRYVLPEPDCDVDATETAPIGVITTRDGRVQRTMTADGVRFLTRIWGTTCNGQRVARTARLGFSDSWSVRGTGGEMTLNGSLEVTRRSGSESLVVEDIQGSVLFDLTLPGTRELPASADRVSLPLVVDPGRCDEHARSQSTQTFLFRLWIRVADNAAVPVTFSPTASQQTRMLAFLDQACG